MGTYDALDANYAKWLKANGVKISQELIDALEGCENFDAALRHDMMIAQAAALDKRIGKLEAAQWTETEGDKLGREG